MTRDRTVHSVEWTGDTTASTAEIGAEQRRRMDEAC
jgi:hypothetical protein